MLEIAKVKLKDLTFYENNPKAHNAASTARLQASIKRFGMNSFLGIYGPGNVLVYGEGRAKALLALYGEDYEADCVRLDHLTEEESKEFRLVENQTQAMTGFDESLLAKELDNILDVDMSEFGLLKRTPKLDRPPDEVKCPECGMVFDGNIKHKKR